MGWFSKDDNKKSESSDENKRLTLDPRTQIIKNSSRTIGALKIISNFFNNPILNDILEQTEFIQSIFEKNDELNYKKLEQHNYYYTDNLISMLSKIKKSREETIMLLNERLERSKKKLNDRKDNLSLSTTRPNLDNERKKWCAEISHQLTIAYRYLCKNTENQPKNIKHFLELQPSNNYYYISFETFDKFSNYSDSDFYSAADCLVQRKLMGKLNKNVFNIEFKHSFKCDGQDFYLYLFQIRDTGDWFVYIPTKKLFKLVESTQILKFVEKKNSFYGQKEHELETEHEKLEAITVELSKQRSIYETETLDILKKYLDKINDTELLTDLSVIDIDRKFLEDMLKIEKFKI